MTRRFEVELQDGSGHVLEYIVMCSARFYRCCGEGTLKCEREADHAGEPHTAEGVDW